MRFTALAAGVLALTAAGGAEAQKVYRCGPDGRSYQQAPCAEGRAVDASDPRTAEQRQAAQEVARKEAKTAAKFDTDMSAASAAKPGKVKPQSAPVPEHQAASATKPASKKSGAESRPPMYLAPKPKDAASAAKR